jgi:hypothetical protein
MQSNNLFQYEHPPFNTITPPFLGVLHFSFSVVYPKGIKKDLTGKRE